MAGEGRCGCTGCYSIQEVTTLFTWIYARPLEQIIMAMVIGVLLWSAAAYLFMKHRILRHLWRYGNLCLLLFSAAVILYMTVFSRNAGETEVILAPFYSFYEARVQPELYRSMLMNVFLFVPFGLAMPYAFPDRSGRSGRQMIRTVLAGLLLSCAIEILQYVFRLGRAETDDLLCNTLGAAVGSSSYKFSHLWIKHNFKKG